MGGANHFSRTLPTRGQTLLDELYEQKLPKAPDSDFTLKATFLLSVAMPMVILPMERIVEYAYGKGAGHANDAKDPALIAKVTAKLDAMAADPGLFLPGKWRVHVHNVKQHGALDLAGSIVEAIAVKLKDPQADVSTAPYDTKYLLDIIRNAFAHGGVLFLDSKGDKADGTAVQKFTFVSTDWIRTPSEYRFLRVGMKDFREFLAIWADWLNESGAEAAMDEAVPVT